MIVGDPDGDVMGDVDVGDGQDRAGLRVESNAPEPASISTWSSSAWEASSASAWVPKLASSMVSQPFSTAMQVPSTKETS